MMNTFDETINEYERIFGPPEKRPTLFPDDDESYLRLRDFIISSDVEIYDPSILPFSSITDTIEYEAKLTSKYIDLNLRIRQAEEEKRHLETKKEEIFERNEKSKIISVLNVPVILLISSMAYSKSLLLGILKTLGNRPE